MAAADPSASTARSAPPLLPRLGRRRTATGAGGGDDGLVGSGAAASEVPARTRQVITLATYADPAVQPLCGLMSTTRVKEDLLSRWLLLAVVACKGSGEKTQTTQAETATDSPPSTGVTPTGDVDSSPPDLPTADTSTSSTPTADTGASFDADCARVETVIAAATKAGAGEPWWLHADATDLAWLDDPRRATECGYMLRQIVDTTASPEAVCNDGTPAIYYVQEGSTDPDSWVVYLKGGSGCFSEPACRDRWSGGRFNDLMTSSESFWGPVASSMLSGLLSVDPVANPDFSGWTKVWMLYCSSDGWSGAKTGSGGAKPVTQSWAEKVGLDGSSGDAEIQRMYDEGTWHFRGAAIVDAVFAELDDPARGPSRSIADAERIVIAGSSAGASGVRNHVDRLAEEVLPAVEVSALHDAGWFPPTVNPDPDVVEAGMVGVGYDPAEVASWRAAASYDTRQRLLDIGVDPGWLKGLTTPDALQAWEMYAGSLRYGVDYVGAADTMDADCVGQTDGTPLAASERWLCLEPYVATAFIDTPMFVYQDQVDPTDMGRVLLDPGDPLHQQLFAVGVAAMVTTAQGCFSPNVCTHEAAHDSVIWTGGEVEGCDGVEVTTQLDGVAYQAAFGDWLFQRGGDACYVAP